MLFKIDESSTYEAYVVYVFPDVVWLEKILDMWLDGLMQVAVGDHNTHSRLSVKLV